LFFAATMASLAAITLLRRGTALEGVWVLNPIAYQELTSLGGSVLGFSSARQAAEKLRLGLAFWVAQRFTAAVNPLF
jgi:hypothetical protein